MKQTINKQQIEWRRAQVLELSAKGRNETQIAKILHVSQPTVSLDIKYLRAQAKQQTSKYVEETMPLEYQKCLIGLDDTIARMTDIIEKEGGDPRDAMSAATIRMHAYRFKAEVLDAGIALDKVITFVANAAQQHKSNDKDKDKDIPQSNTQQNGKVRIDNNNNDISKDA